LKDTKKKGFHFDKVSNGLLKEQELMLVPFIINYVGDYFNAEAGYEVSNSRDKISVHHKYLAMFLIKENTEHLTLKGIAGYFFKDHSAVIHGIKRITNFLFYDAEIRKQIFEIQNKINTKIEKILDDIYDETIEQEYYKLNLNSFTSIKIHGCNKFIIGVNFTDSELDIIKGLFNTIETRKHTNTGFFLCEPKITNQYDGKYKGKKTEGEDSRKQNTRNVEHNGNDTAGTC
jgi:hypothetical protein